MSILGTAGLPASYGGFETLAENLVKYADAEGVEVALSVYCCAKPTAGAYFGGARLRYVPVNANGASSVLYDMISLVLSVFRKDEVILLLGVSGAVAIPLIMLFTRVKIITNIDGIEWKRDKWGWFSKRFLRFSEYLAVRFSHEIITDNSGIADHVKRLYSVPSTMIAYGGDHAYLVNEKPLEIDLPGDYALALCRIEPENNVCMILDAFSVTDEKNLVFVGNWEASVFGRLQRRRFKNCKNIYMLDPIYDVEELKYIRARADIYIHGHSAGGTNPSLVEMMHFGVAVLAFDCIFNRCTTDEKAIFFSSGEQLAKILKDLNGYSVVELGEEMKRLAQERYTWKKIGEEYFKLLLA